MYKGLGLGECIEDHAKTILSWSCTIVFFIVSLVALFAVPAGMFWFLTKTWPQW